jgi:hypothetical protein
VLSYRDRRRIQDEEAFRVKSHFRHVPADTLNVASNVSPIVASKQRSGFIGIINSLVFLWMASALLLSGLGSLFSQTNQCIVDAEKLEERYLEISQALDIRLKTIGDKLLQAENSAEVIAAIALKEGNPQISGPRGLSLVELYRVYSFPTHSLRIWYSAGEPPATPSHITSAR